MRNHILAITVFASLAGSGCKQLECAEGTIERDGQCEPSLPGITAICGSFTVLQGDRCVPLFPPTECDPGTTESDIDPATGVTTCIGTGTGGCGSPLACPTPTGGSKQTICGQLYDFETNVPFSDVGATGQACDPGAPTPTGPCALRIQAYNAVAFAGNPGGATPLTVTNTLIDTCGRYRLSDIETGPAGPFVGLGIDDASGMGPGGVTVTVGIATPTLPGASTKGLEGFVTTNATVTKWVNSGGPGLTTGVYAAIFRQHKVGNGDLFANQAGVQILKSPSTPVTANDFYFEPTELTRTTIEPTATVTGMNGTAFVNNATLNDGLYVGTGGLGAGCRWEPHAAASLVGIVFIQVFRKIDISGMTCLD